MAPYKHEKRRKRGLQKKEGKKKKEGKGKVK